MYQNHVPTLTAAIRHSPKVFSSAVMFAAVSARTHFITVPAQMLELEMRGRKAKCLWSWKTSAFDFVQAHGRRLHETIARIDCPEKALRAICEIPGLGIVKGAFVLQMMGHDLACLDTRNIERDGRDPLAYATRGIKTGKAFEAKVARYVADTFGRSQQYWDDWCADVAVTYKKTPFEISAMHLCFVPMKLQRLAPVAVPLKTNVIPF